IVSDAVAQTILASTWAGIAGVDTVSVAAIGGTIDLAKFPSAVNDIVYQTKAAAAVTVVDQASALTVATWDNGNGKALNVSTATGVTSSLTVIIGNDTTTALGTLGALTVANDSTVTLTANAKGLVDTIAGVTLTPATGGSEA